MPNKLLVISDFQNLKKSNPAELLELERFSNGNGRNSAVVRELQTKQKCVILTRRGASFWRGQGMW